MSSRKIVMRAVREYVSEWWGRRQKKNTEDSVEKGKNVTKRRLITVRF